MKQHAFRWLLLLLVASCYETPSTLGLACDVDAHCFGDQRCHGGTCVDALATPDGRACSADGAFYCGYGSCFCDAEAPFCCADGHCYASMDECGQSWGVTECPGGGECSVCRVLDGKVDVCSADIPYCCFERGPAADEIYCNEAPESPCG
jgi:hypothetical protein